MKRLFSCSLAALAFTFSFAVIGCGGDEPAPLETTEEDVAIEEDASSGMEDAMKQMGKKK
jgi:hypothetical protein